MDGGKHQEPTSHELRELKKQQKLEQRQQQSAVAHEQNSKRKRYTYSISIALILLAAIVVWKWSSTSVTAAASVDIGDHPTVGPAISPIQFVIFGDFQCPFTRRFWQGAFPKIIENYGDKIKITYWPVPTAKHNYDRASAQAAYCANEQGRFWEYSKVLFDRQGAATDGDLADYARELKLDADAFWACYSSGKYKDKVQEDYVAGRKYGVVQTPTVAINKHVLSGDLPFEDYRTFIEFEFTQG